MPIASGAMPVFFTGGFGLPHFSPEDNSLDNETRFSMNVGLATKIAVTESLSFRFGGRLYATFFNSDSDIFAMKKIALFQSPVIYGFKVKLMPE